jgi:hypothetical protein
MHTAGTIVCDGCGQSVATEHIARRLKRLENMTRYRPVHVQALFLGAVAPPEDGEYLYSARDDSAQCDSVEGAFQGEGRRLLRAVGMEPAGRTAEATLAEFQRRGYLLAHALECADEQGVDGGRHADPSEALGGRIPAVIARIRRSFKPKRLVLLGGELAEFIPQFTLAQLDASLVLRDGKPFEWNELECGLLAKELAALS